MQDCSLNESHETTLKKLIFNTTVMCKNPFKCIKLQAASNVSCKPDPYLTDTKQHNECNACSYHTIVYYDNHKFQITISISRRLNGTSGLLMFICQHCHSATTIVKMYALEQLQYHESMTLRVLMSRVS